MSTWSAITSTSEANRRAAGRRHYNAQRQFSAHLRRIEVQRLLLEYGYEHGVRARIAARLGVHPSVITRDVQRLSGSMETACPTCERTMTDKQWERLEGARCRRAYNVLAATCGVSGAA